MKFITDPRYQRVMKWVTAVMALAYTGMGAALLLSLGDLQHVPAMPRIPLGLMMVCYGLFRAWRFVKQYYSKKEEDEV